MLSYLIEEAHQWLWHQRNTYIAKARSLSDNEKRLLKDYYGRGILHKVRVATVERISNPEFYDDLLEAGYPVLDISQASAIAFVDCVVIRSLFEQHRSLWMSILFHEMVHVVQAEILGSRTLVESYLQAWVRCGCQYDAIPLEEQAHRLEAKFGKGQLPFSVVRAVEKELRDAMPPQLEA